MDDAEGDGDGGDEQDDGRLYCFCNGVSYGDMIGCDDANCEREWVSADRLYACESDVDGDPAVSSGVHRARGCARGDVVLQRVLDEEERGEAGRARRQKEDWRRALEGQVDRLHLRFTTDEFVPPLSRDISPRATV